MEMCKIEKIARLVAQVSGWDYVEMKSDYSQDWNRHITKGDNTIFLTYDGGKRIKISGSWPRNIKGEMYAPATWDIRDCGIEGYTSEITVSVDKTPEKIWGDITKRFLPGYLAMFSRKMEQVEDSNKYYNTSEGNAKKLADVLGVELKAKYNTDSLKSVHYYSRGHASADFETSQNEVSIKISSCPMSVALKIAELLKQEA